MNTTRPLVVVGDALLDRDVDGHVSRLCPDAPVPVLDDATEKCRPGGAALAALLAASDGVPVVLVAPLGDDPASRTVRALLEPQVTVVGLPLTGPLPEKTRFRANGRTLLRADPPAGAAGPAGTDAADAIGAAGAVLVSDYGRGVTADERIRAALAAQARRVPVLWDPHPRGAPPVRGARLATPNYAEAVTGADRPDGRDAPVLGSATAAARRLCDQWGVDAVCVTLGDRGAILVQGGTGPLVIPAERLEIADPCGAGDRFAATAAAALRQGALTSEAVTAAVAAASSYLSSGGAGRYSSPGGFPSASWPSRPGQGELASTAGERLVRQGAAGPGAADRDAADRDAADLAHQVRAAGGTVVATGGCFDLLHAGHVGLLQAARSLGDCLIVCLNSDASVRRLKGGGRPINQVADRAAVLAALGCVDAIAVFDEDTPCGVLDRIRPGIWVKGGDYDGRELPEAETLKNWGGVAVTVPYLSGRSTTRLHAASMSEPGRG